MNPALERILIVEDLEWMQEVVRMKLRKKYPAARYETAATRDESTQKLHSFKPEVIILDSDLKDCDGLQLIEEFLQSKPKPKVIVYSAFVDEFTVHRVHKSGASGFVTKSMPPIDALGEAVESAMAGKEYYTDDIKLILKDLQSDPIAFSKTLSEREMEVLGVLGCHRTNGEVAAETGLSANTVKNHRGRILKKLNLKASQLLRYAWDKGFTRYRTTAPRGLRATAPLSRGPELYQDAKQPPDSKS